MTLTIADTASLLNCSKSHVARIIRGQIRDLPPLPALRAGRRVLIREQTFINWLRTLEEREIDELRMAGTYFDWESIGGA